MPRLKFSGALTFAIVVGAGASGVIVACGDDSHSSVADAGPIDAAECQIHCIQLNFDAAPGDPDAGVCPACANPNGICPAGCEPVG